MTEHTGLRHKISDVIQDHKIISVLLALALIAGGYYFYTTIKTSNTPVRYGVTQVQKGTLVVSVAGSGQVLASSQIDIKPKVSGTVTSVLVQEGDKVTTGQVIAKLDSTQAQKNVRDAKLNLQSAQVALQKLVQPPDQYTLIQAENALAQAQRDYKTLTDPPTAYDVTLAQNSVDQAQRNLSQAQINSTQQVLTDEQSMQTANNDAYNNLSTAFVDAAKFLSDIHSVQTNGTSFYENINAYKLILGADYSAITDLVNNYDSARTQYNSVFDRYKVISRTVDQSTLYQFLSDTIVMEKIIGQNLEDARNIFNAITAKDYKSYSIASTVDQLKPVIENDIATFNKDLSSLQTSKDKLDTLIQNGPTNVQKSQDALIAAQEALKEKQEFLAKLLAGALPADVASAQDKVNQAAASLKKVQTGADPLDIKNQQLNVQQRKNALADAQSSLDDYSMKSPFDGVIAKVTSVLGDTALSGQNSASSTAIATIITKQFLAQVSLNEVDAAKVKIGDKTTLTFDAVPDITVAGQLVQLDIIGTSTQGVVSYNAKIAFDAQDSRVKPGMSVTAAIVTQVDQDVLLVPNAAVKTQGTTSYVSVFDTSLVTPGAADTTTGTVVTLQQPQRVLVQSAASNDTNTEISSGLQEGEYVVTQTYSNGSTAAASSTSGSSAIRLPGLGGGGFSGGRPGG